MPEQTRADVALVQRGLAASRERAQELIKAELVHVNGETLKKCSRKLEETDEITILGEVHPYVGRGGCKLERALEVFGNHVGGRVCVDVGASTGGFTDVLLRNGAAKVYAVDVGTGQLDPRLLNDARVVSMEKTNARTLKKEMFSPVPTLAVMDVSFISIRLILPALFELVGREGRVISLIKPQFEAGPQAIGKNGIVKQTSTHKSVIREIRDFAETCGWRFYKLTYSPITGTAGNHEFLAEFAPVGGGVCIPISDKQINETVETACKALRQ